MSNDPIRFEYKDEVLMRQYGYDLGYTGETLAALRNEDLGFRPIGLVPQAANFDECELIGLRKKACPFCGWSPEELHSERKLLILHEGIKGGYLKQEHDYVMKRELKITDADGERLATPPEPIVTRRKIRAAISAGLVPRIFLEEIDKTPRLTDWRSSVLFGIINECYEQCGQIVVNSNRTVLELEEHFGAYDGGAIIRRFTKDSDPEKARTFTFFKKAKS